MTHFTKKTEQPYLSATVQTRQFSMLCHIPWMPDEWDAKQILPSGELEEITRTWMKTTQQDLESLNLSLNEAVDVAQNRPLWRMMSTFGATHS